MGSLPWKLAVAIPALTGGLCCILAVKAHVKVRPAVPSLSALPPSRRHPAVGCAPAQPNNNRITAVQVGEVAHPVVERVDAFVEQETGVSLKLLDKQACLDALYEKMPKDRYGDVDQDELQVNFRPSFTAYCVFVQHRLLVRVCHAHASPRLYLLSQKLAMRIIDSLLMVYQSGRNRNIIDSLLMLYRLAADGRQRAAATVHYDCCQPGVQRVVSRCTPNPAATAAAVVVVASVAFECR